MTSDTRFDRWPELRRKNGHEAPWKVAYFAIGNEPWGCGGNMRPEHYADLVRQDATFLRTPPGRRARDHRQRREPDNYRLDRGR